MKSIFLVAAILLPLAAGAAGTRSPSSSAVALHPARGVHVLCVAEDLPGGGVSKAELEVTASEQDGYAHYAIRYDGVTVNSGMSYAKKTGVLYAQQVEVSDTGEYLSVGADLHEVTLAYQTGYSRHIEGTRAGSEWVPQPGMYRTHVSVLSSMFLRIRNADSTLVYLSTNGDMPGLFEYPELDDSSCTVTPVY